MPLGAFKAALMGTAGVSTGDVVLLSTQTASNSASLSFTSDITSTYGEYILKFYNINPATDVGYFHWQGSTDGGSSYGVNMTTTAFNAYHKEDDSQADIGYIGGSDLAQSTSYQQLAVSIANDADGSCAGTLHLFNPASTTYVKHFYSTFQGMDHDDVSQNAYMAGYINTTSAIDALNFKFASGNFDGKIKMWGVK